MTGAKVVRYSPIGFCIVRLKDVGGESPLYAKAFTDNIHVDERTMDGGS